MDSGMFDDMAKGIVYMVIALLILSFCLGGLAIWGLPKLWILLIKPVIHAITV